MLHSLTFALSRIKTRLKFNHKQKKKISAYPVQPEKEIIKNHKTTAFLTKCTILNRYASRNIEMINSEK